MNDSDVPQVVEKVNELIHELGGHELDAEAAEAACKSLLDNPDRGALLVAVNDARSLVGFCSLSYQTAIRTVGLYAIVQEMFVSQRYRNDNVGSALLHKAVTTAAAAGCRVVELGTPLHGERQERFYQKHAFSVVGARMRLKLAN